MTPLRDEQIEIIRKFCTSCCTPHEQRKELRIGTQTIYEYNVSQEHVLIWKNGGVEHTIRKVSNSELYEICIKILTGIDPLQSMNFYFTYGSADNYPFKDGYIIVRARSMQKAIEKYRFSYPDVHCDTVNCSFYYSQEEWDALEIKLKESKPLAILY